jgi:acetyltransferase-like isoleucine patch superfamily enzyme
VIRRAFQVLREEWQVRRNPVAYARRLGVNLPDDCWLAGLTRGAFGTEPFLITIGEHCAVASGARFITHDGGGYVFRQEFPDVEHFEPITLGDNVMIGMNAILLPGTTIGSNTVIGAGSVVSGDVPSGVVYAGVPAKFVCSIEAYREKCLEKAFWNLPKEPEARKAMMLAFLDGKVDDHGRPIAAPEGEGSSPA